MIRIFSRIVYLILWLCWSCFVINGIFWILSGEYKDLIAANYRVINIGYFVIGIIGGIVVVASLIIVPLIILIHLFKK